jgi:hypothetical protein
MIPGSPPTPYGPVGPRTPYGEETAAKEAYRRLQGTDLPSEMPLEDQIANLAAEVADDGRRLADARRAAHEASETLAVCEQSYAMATDRLMGLIQRLRNPNLTGVVGGPIR